MAPTVAPEAAPGLARQKAYPPMAPPRRGSSPLLAILLVAIVLFVAIGTIRMIYKPPGDGERVQVVAAGMDIPAGCRLGYTSLHYVQIPRQYVTADMFSTYAQAVGRVTKTFVPRGEPISSTMLFAGNAGLAQLLDRDQRAITLELSGDALLDHCLCPGDYVDVIATVTESGKKFSRTVCQAVMVLLAVPRQALMAQRARTGDVDKVTLAVSPAQAEELAEASQVGKLRLVLRNGVNRNTEALAGVSQRDLFPAAYAATAQPTAPAGRNDRLLAELPPPPPPLPAVAIGQSAGDLRPPAPIPVQWIVEVFSGSRKATYAFPQKSN
ncbi:MAG TPA: Flp pilus assembly protein CpaB [Candidatus Obscuribacterales bacterium]